MDFIFWIITKTQSILPVSRLFVTPIFPIALLIRIYTKMYKIKVYDRVWWKYIHFQMILDSFSTYELGGQHFENSMMIIFCLTDNFASTSTEKLQLT